MMIKPMGVWGSFFLSSQAFRRGTLVEQMSFRSIFDESLSTKVGSTRGFGGQERSVETASSSLRYRLGAIC